MDTEYKEKRRKYQIKWRIKNKERHRTHNKINSKNSAMRHPEYKAGWQLRKFYGITNEQKNLMVLAQQNKCTICENVFKNTLDCCIDHNHISKKIRGILCRRCNTGLGFFRDNKLILSNAISYLERYEI